MEAEIDKDEDEPIDENEPVFQLDKGKGKADIKAEEYAEDFDDVKSDDGIPVPIKKEENCDIDLVAMEQIMPKNMVRKLDKIESFENDTRILSKKRKKRTPRS